MKNSAPSSFAAVDQARSEWIGALENLSRDESGTAHTAEEQARVKYQEAMRAANEEH